MARVLLIDPRGWQGAVNGYRAYPNIGIAYLISMLFKHSHEVLVLDLNNEKLADNEVLAQINRYRPEVIGFSAKTATIRDARGLAKQIKDSFPGLPLLVGGPHVILNWRELVREPFFDILFVGEGEEMISTVSSLLVKNEPIENIPGVVTKRNFNDFTPSNYPLVCNLDSLPFPDYEPFPENVKKTIQTGYPLVTSRGCVYQCTYCSVPNISGRRFRKRSAGNIIEELKCAQEKYGIAAFEIIDDLFNLDIGHCKDICRALIDADLGMNWSCPNGLRADRVDRELAELMFNSGCQSVIVGVESADESILKAVNKGETIDDIKCGIRIFQEKGINVGGYFIIGLPGDSFELEKQSVEFAKDMFIDAHFNMLVPYPGTELWNWAKKNARFLCDVEEGAHFADSSKKVKPVIETEDFSSRKRRLAYEMVHTRLKRFDLVVPAGLSRCQRNFRVFLLIWKYDIREIPRFVFLKTIAVIRRIARRLNIRYRENRKEIGGIINCRDPLEICNLLRAYLPVKGSLALDIGANTGQYIDLFASKFDKVLAFEPSEEAFSVLSRKLSSRPNLEIRRDAVLDKTGTTCLYRHQNTKKDLDLTILKDEAFDWGPSVDKITVPSVRLDDLGLRGVDFIKIDTEGAELPVIRGGLDTIHKNRPTLFIEIHSESAGGAVKGLLGDFYYYRTVRHPSYAPNTCLWKNHYFMFAFPKVKES